MRYLKKLRKLSGFIIGGCFLAKATLGWAFESEVYTEAVKIDFGRAVLLASTSSVHVSYNGNPLWLRAAKSNQGTQPVAGTITFRIAQSEWPEEHDVIYIMPNVTSTASFPLGSGAKCSLELSNISFSAPQVVLTKGTNEATLYVGATIKVKGFCDSDYDYAGSVNIPYSVLDSTKTELKSGVVVLPVTFQSEYNNDLVKDKDMNFGEIITDKSEGYVTLSPEGLITAYSDGVETVRGTISAGEVSIYGAYGLAITDVSVDDMIYLYNGEHAMRVDTFTLSPGKSFSLDTEKNNQGYNLLKVGGTLHINENQPAGTYTGVLNIVISY